MIFNTLVVDDSAVMRRMIIRTLELSGVPVGDIHEAGHGKEALAVLDEHWVDLALVDINMPVMNGLCLAVPFNTPSTSMPSLFSVAPAACVAMPNRSVRQTSSFRRFRAGSARGQLSRNGMRQDASKKLSFCHA